MKTWKQYAFIGIFILVFSTCDPFADNNNNENDVKVIVEPMTKTKWGQGNPYNSMFPMVGNTRPETGCGLIATAQIMKFHNRPTQYSEVDFNWGNMLNSYTNSSNEQQRNAVATLVYHLREVKNIPLYSWAIVLANLGYDRSVQLLYREYYDNTSWEAIIKTQLDAGLPVYYWGINSTNTLDHAFIIDGYDNSGKFHINWGWYGEHDGYYSLNALNPKGLDLSHKQHIIVNIKPNENSIGSNEMALMAFSSKATVFQNEQFTVTAQLRSTGFFTGGQAGVALVDNGGNIVEVIRFINFNALDPESWRGITLNNCSISTVGQYRLMIVTKQTDGEWKKVLLAHTDIPNSIDFTVQ